MAGISWHPSLQGPDAAAGNHLLEPGPAGEKTEREGDRERKRERACRRKHPAATCSTKCSCRDLKKDLLTWPDLRGQLRARYGRSTGSVRATGYWGYWGYGHAYERYRHPARYGRDQPSGLKHVLPGVHIHACTHT